MNRQSELKLHTVEGFTLIEILVSMAIGSVLILAGSMIMIDGVKWTKATARNLEITASMSILWNVLGREIENAGGGAVKSWMAIMIENTAGATPCAPRAPLGACGTSDRLVVAHVANDFVECSVSTSTNNTEVTLVSGPGCCVDGSRDVMMIVNNQWTQRRVTSFDSGTCTYTLSDGPMVANDRIGGVVNWAGGVFVGVNVATFYIDSSKSQLRRFADLNFNGNIDSGEDLLIADRVAQLQVGFGYDFSPPDGFLTELPVGTDEILFNFAGEVFGAGHFATATPLALNAVVMGLLLVNEVGEIKQQIGSTAMLDGPVISKSGFELIPSFSRFIPRNGLVY